MEGAGVAHFPADLYQTVIDALDACGLGIAVADSGRCAAVPVYVNPAMARIAGSSVDTLLAGDGLPLAPGEQQRLADALGAALGVGAAVSEVFRSALVRADGARVPVELTCAAIEYQGAPATITFVRDITDWVAIEDALRQSESNFRSLADAAPDAIGVLVDGVFVYANQATAVSLGFDSGAELVGSRMSSFLVEEDMRAFLQRLPRVMAGEQLPPREYRALRRDGTISVMEISAILSRYHGQPAVVAIGRDTRGRREAQAALMQSDRLATTGLLAAGVAHEINNPLTYVLLHLTRVQQLVQEAGLSNRVQAQIAELLTEGILGAERIRDVVRDLLSFARPTKVRAEPVEVRRVLDSALKLAGHVLRDCAVVQLDLQDVPTIRGDEAQLGQAFLNVLINAAQSFDGGGPGHNQVDVRLFTDSTAGEIVFQVQDNGRGIDAALLRHLFDPLTTMQAPGTGTGLGLAITRSVLDNIGGDIEVKSNVGVGTLVTVRIPVTSATDSERSHAQAVIPEVPRARVLLVDDDRTVAQALAALLELEHLVDVCHDGDTALERLAGTKPYDVVVCDLVMPGTTGVAVFEQVTRTQPEYAPKFLFLTGGVSAPAMITFIEAHDGSVLQKPITPDQFMAAVASRIPPGGPLRP